MTERLYFVGVTVNDNETYTSLGFQTLLILNRLRNNAVLLDMDKGTEEDNPKGAEEPKEHDGSDKRPTEHAEAVNQRLRDLAQFEKRYGRK